MAALLSAGSSFGEHGSRRAYRPPRRDLVGLAGCAAHDAPTIFDLPIAGEW
jgi:hypothetical protein